MISINATLVVQLLNFLVLVWILNQILFKPTFKVLAEREKVVEQAKNESLRLKTEAQEKAVAVESKLDIARKEAAANRDEIRIQASAQALEITNQAQAQAQEHIQAVRTETSGEVRKARESLEQFKEAIVEMVHMKVLGRKAG